MKKRKTNNPPALQIMSIDISSVPSDLTARKLSISNDKKVDGRIVTEKFRELINVPKHTRTNAIRDLTRKTNALLDGKISDDDTADLVGRFPGWGKMDFAELLALLRKVEKRGLAPEGKQDATQPRIGDLDLTFQPSFPFQAPQDKKPEVPLLSKELLEELRRKSETKHRDSASRQTGRVTNTVEDCAALATLCFVIGAVLVWVPVAEALTSRPGAVFSASLAFLVMAAFTLLSLLNTGQAIDTSHIWVLKGSQSKVRDATVAAVYEHTHGSGSWHQKVMKTRRQVRRVGTALAILLPMVLVVSGRVKGFGEIRPWQLGEVTMASVASCVLSRLSFTYVFFKLDVNARVRIALNWLLYRVLAVVVQPLGALVYVVCNIKTVNGGWFPETTNWVLGISGFCFLLPAELFLLLVIFALLGRAEPG